MIYSTTILSLLSMTLDSNLNDLEFPVLVCGSSLQYCHKLYNSCYVLLNYKLLLQHTILGIIYMCLFYFTHTVSKRLTSFTCFSFLSAAIGAASAPCPSTAIAHLIGLYALDVSSAVLISTLAIAVICSTHIISYFNPIFCSRF